jgi:hypothetical protein
MVKVNQQPPRDSSMGDAPSSHIPVNRLNSDSDCRCRLAGLHPSWTLRHLRSLHENMLVAVFVIIVIPCLIKSKKWWQSLLK